MRPHSQFQASRIQRGLVRWLLAALTLVGLAAPVRGLTIDKFIKPGEKLSATGFLLSQEPLLCEITACPNPPLGGQPVNEVERAISLFLPFTEVQLQHPAESFFFRAGDWNLRLEAPNQPNGPFPVDLTEFREQHLELGTGVIGDQAGEGVVLYFPWPPEVWQSAQQISLDLVIHSLTGGTDRERSYFVRGAGRGGLPPVRLCPAKDGDPRLDVIVQRSPTGFSPTPFDGAVDEIVVYGRTATFYIAVVSELPGDGPGVQGWNLFAALSDVLKLVQVTTAGTVVRDVDLQYSYPTPPDIIHPDTGLPQGEGFVATAIPAADGPPWTLPPVGTTTVLRVTVETKEEIPDGGKVTGEIVWRDNMVGADPETGERAVPWRNNFAVRSRVHYPCTCGGARLVFRSLGFLELLVPPGEHIQVPDVLVPELSAICELIQCPRPRFGEEDPNAPREDGFSFFLPFAEIQLTHEVGTPFFQPGDWELRLEDPTNQLPGFPAVLEEFREDQLELGNRVIGDQPGEGIVIFFGLPPEIAAAARERMLDLVLSNRTGDERKREYLIHSLGFGALPRFRLCPSPRGDSRLDVIVQDRLIGSTEELLAGSTGEVRHRATPGERGRGSFYAGIVSDFAEPDVGVQGWSLAGSVTGDLRVVGGSTVGFPLVSLSEGFQVFQVLDPTILHPDTGRPQGEGFVQAVVLSYDRPLTLPPRGTETVCEVVVETLAPVSEGASVHGRVEWRDNMRGRGQPVGNVLTVLGESYRFCTCGGADLVFLGAVPDCNRNGRDDRDEVATGAVSDCNRNGIPDSCDLESGTSLDELDRNGVPDECQCSLRCEAVADHYHAPPRELNEVILGDVRLTDAVERNVHVPFTVLDCNNQDGDTDLWIRSSFATRTPATLHLDSACPGGTLPRFVSLRLITDDALIAGYDALGRVVASAAASRPYREQVLTLSSSRGIERVAILARRTCLIEVCWCCDLVIPPSRFERGDTNGDGRVDLSDAVSGLNFLFQGGAAPSCMDAADSNDDGRLDISDPVRTLNFLFLGAPAPPSPGPFDCGPDPTPSQLGACGETVCP